MEETGFNPNKLKEIREETEANISCPDGYIEVKLSTKGLIGAPKVFHIRNFSAEDLMNLSLADKEDVPMKLLKTLGELIWEKEINIGTFHEKEVVELLLLLYEVFYTEVFPNQKWVPTDEDWEFLEQQCGGKDTDDFRARKRALDTEQWKPTFDINIKEDISFFEIDPNIKTNVKIERDYSGKKFSVVFSLPKFGDFLILKKFVDIVYRDKDKQFARIAEMIKFRKESEDRLAKGENINISTIPNVPKAEYDKYKEYESEKTLFVVTASKALYLKEFNGEDLEGVPLEKKIELAKDPRLDYSTFKLVEDHIKKLEFGYKEDITVHDPIMNKVVTRKYTFQLVDLLTAIRDSGTSKTTVSFI